MKTVRYLKALPILVLAMSVLPSYGAHAATTTTNCAGVNAIARAQYSVNKGQWLNHLPANVPQGSTVDVSLLPKAGCGGTAVGVAAYEATSATWDSSRAQEQKRVASEVAVLHDGQTTVLHAKLPDCFYQIDVFTGESLEHLSAVANYSKPTNRLIAATTGGTTVCPNVAPAKTTTTSTTAAAVAPISITTTTSTSTTSTTMPPAVLGETLAHTGSGSALVSGAIAAALLAVGGLFLALRVRRRAG